MCGCNGTTETWTATPNNGASVRDFPDKVQADLYLDSNGGGTRVKK